MLNVMRVPLFSGVTVSSQGGRFDFSSAPEPIPSQVQVLTQKPWKFDAEFSLAEAPGVWLEEPPLQATMTFHLPVRPFIPNGPTVMPVQGVLRYEGPHIPQFVAGALKDFEKIGQALDTMA